MKEQEKGEGDGVNSSEGAVWLRQVETYTETGEGVRRERE